MSIITDLLPRKLMPRHTTILKILLITIYNSIQLRVCLRLLWNDEMKRIRLWPQPAMHDSTWKHVYFCFHTITILHIFCNDMSFTCKTLVNSRWTNLYVRWQPLFILIKGLKCDSSISGFKNHIIIETKQHNIQNVE